MNRRETVDPPWTLEASEDCLLELRKSARSLRVETATNDDDGVRTPIVAAARFPSWLLHDKNDKVTTPDVEDRHSYSLTPPRSEIWGRSRLLFSARRRSSDNYYVGGRSAVAEGNDEATDEDDDGLESTLTRQKEERDRDEEESRALARQLYEFVEPAEFLSHLEQNILASLGYAWDKDDDANDGDNDDEFGDFQSAMVTPANDGVEQQQEEDAEESRAFKETAQPASPSASASPTTDTGDVAASSSHAKFDEHDGSRDGNKEGGDDERSSHDDCNVRADSRQRQSEPMGWTPSPMVDASKEKQSKSTTPTMSTPVLLERVESILGSRGKKDAGLDDNDAAERDANDSSGDATCDTQHLVQFTDSLLLVAKGGTGTDIVKCEDAVKVDREHLIEEKKEECLCVDDTTRLDGTESGAAEHDVAACATPGPTPQSYSEECDLSLSSSSRECRQGEEEVTSVSTASNPSLYEDDFAAVPFATDAPDVDQLTVPQVIEAPCIHADATSLLGSDERKLQQSGPEKLEDQRLVSRLSMQLPVTDLTTLEGRFVRRRQQLIAGEPSNASTTRTASDGASLQLPSFYYSSTIDDTVHVLRSLPWGLLLDSEEEEDRMQWDERIEIRLRELDVSLSDVQARIASSLSTQDLDAVNSLVHEWQTHLDLALMYANRAKGSLDGVLDQPSDVDELWRQRETVRELLRVLECVESFVQDKLGLDARIDAFDACCRTEYESLSRLAKRLASQGAESPLSEVRCLDGVRSDVQSFPRRFWDRLLALNEETTIRLCGGEKIDVVRYRQLLNQVVELDLESTADATINYQEEWSQSTRRTLCCETERALAQVLFECSSADSSLEHLVEPLKAEFNNAGSDRTRIRAITHNLVILRFQLSFSNLAQVTHALLRRMWNVIGGHQQLVAITVDVWGGVPLEGMVDDHMRDNKLIRAICTDLQDSRRDVWDHCVGVLARMFTEYFSFAASPPLFEGEDDSCWAQDVSCLRQVLGLVERFLSMRSSYVEDGCESSLAPGSDLHESIRNVLLRHLRGVHVEAMNASGRVLSNETWILDSADLSCLEGAVDVSTAVSSLSNLMTSVISGAAMDSNCESEVNTDNACPRDSFGATLMEFDAHRVKDLDDTTGAIPSTAPDHYMSSLDLAHLVSSCIEAQDGRLRLMAPRCVTAGVLQWTARLFTVMKLLPLVVEEASSVLVDLLDLHVTTVFRLCCGSAKVEKILLGAVKPTPFVVSHGDVRTPQHRPQAAGSPLFSTMRKGATPSHANGGSRVDAHSSLPAALDAEICSPLLKDLADVLQLRGFLLRAQDGLKDVVNLDKVDAWLSEQRGGLGSASSYETSSLEERCCFAAQVLEKRASALLSCNAVALAVVAGLVDAHRSLSSTRAGGARHVENLELLGNFSRALVSVIPTLWSTAGQYACIRAMGGSDIVRGVVDVGSHWRGHELHEHPNEYVYDASERCALVWGYLSLSRKLPLSTRATLWWHIVGGAHLSILEGFARVSGTTTEGRSLMMLDLATLTGELNGASVTDKLDARSIIASPPPPVPAGSRLDGVVETYVKMTYFPKFDAVAWIEDSVDSYRLHHAIGLARELADDPEELQQLAQRVRQRYAQRESEIVEQSRSR